MFSGIVEQTGSISSVIKKQDGVLIAVSLKSDSDFAPSLGESIACDGVCLTVTDWNARDHLMRFFLSEETLSRSHFKELKPGNRINLERSLKMGDRMSGHWVQGHVDGVGTIKSIAKNGETFDVQVEIPHELSRYCVEKGSITVQGVSLTINAITDSIIRLTIIPHTWQVTTFQQLEPGSLVNIEVDILAKYIEKLRQ